MTRATLGIGGFALHDRGESDHLVQRFAGGFDRRLQRGIQLGIKGAEQLVDRVLRRNVHIKFVGVREKIAFQPVNPVLVSLVGAFGHLFQELVTLFKIAVQQRGVEIVIFAHAVF